MNSKKKLVFYIASNISIGILLFLLSTIFTSNISFGYKMISFVGFYIILVISNRYPKQLIKEYGWIFSIIIISGSAFLLNYLIQ